MTTGGPRGPVRDHDRPTRHADVSGGIAGYGEDQAGELYAASLNGGVYRVSAAAR